jgi:ubiquinol-cytochrome c reductase cytochrome b subunit
MRMNTASSSATSDNARYPFYPNHLFVEAVTALLTLLVLVLLALFWHAPLEEIADPSDTTFVPRPEWYFLFLFQLLKYFKGGFIVVGAVVIPAAASILLFLWPFLDRGEETRLRKRPRSLVLGICSLLAVVALTVVSVVEDAELRMDLPLITEQQLVEGEDIFNRFCILCHSMDGKGGFMAPDMTQVGGRINRVRIERVIMEPQLVSQTTIMSRIPLSDEERHAVSAYLSRKR